MKRLIVLLMSLATLVGLVSVAEPATAGPSSATVTLQRCNYSLDHTECTVIRGGPVTIYDRTDHVNRTWQNGTTVILGYWDVDSAGLCGTHGDTYIWGVFWWSNGHWHWAVLGDWWLDTGGPNQWKNVYGVPNLTMDPYFRVYNNGNGTYCNNGWSALYGDGPGTHV